MAADLQAINARAMTLYALDSHDVPWPAVWSHVAREYRDRAKRELWEEGALRMDPFESYYPDETERWAASC